MLIHMEPMNAKGIDGQIEFDGTAVRITRMGFAAKSIRGWAGEKVIPVASITAVQFRRATAMLNGFVSFTVPGEISNSRSGSTLRAAQRDENAVVIRKSHMVTMEPLVDAIQAAILNPSSHSASTDPLEQLKKLGELRDAGLLSPDEFEEKRLGIVGRIE